jgi:asparagine synthase (glutamine-hydrolysing)
VSGLCVAVRWDGAPLEPHTLEPMTRAASYRGQPSHHLTATAQLAYLAHHPLTPAQPATHHHLAITASARIDNRDELLPGLTAHLPGPNPTDAQLILAAHHRWGDDAPRHLIGDYAYALFDHRTHTLFAARDPMAMRPLYYHHTDRRTLIASEIQQLLASGDVPALLHDAAVVRYLCGEFGVPDETFYREVRALPAGHALRIDRDGARLTRFWQADGERRERYAREQDYAERFRELFLRAVRDRLHDGGPHGLLLSGGVDSGSIASAAGWLAEQGRIGARIHTYSWSFPTLAQCDERHLSRLVVERYGLPSVEVDAEASAPLARYPEHGPHRDEPYIGAYQALLEAGLAAARDDGMRSMWSGDRGDLVSGAWTLDYVQLARRRRWRDLAFELREHAGLPGEGWPRVIGSHLLAPALRRAAGRLRPRWSASRRGPRLTRLPPWLRAEHFERAGVDPDADHEAVPPEALAGYARRERYRLVFVPLHMRGMVWSERTNASFGLGFVDPWSDRRLTEFVLSIPQAVLNRPGELRKRLVREAMRGVMPEELRLGAAKIVPSPLFKRALRQDGVATVRTLLANMEAERRGFLDGAALRCHYDQILRGGPDHPMLWLALTLEMWLRRYWT